MFNRMPARGEQMWTCECVKERACVCVHVCAADVLCSFLFPRLAGLCCCSLVQTVLATCFSVCKDKPCLHCFNLSIAAAKSRPNNTHSLTGSASVLDDAVLLTHANHTPFSLTHTVAVPWTRSTKFSNILPLLHPYKPSLYLIFSLAVDTLRAEISFLKTFLSSSISILGQQSVLLSRTGRRNLVKGKQLGKG